MLDCCGDQCIDFTENYLSYEPGGIGRHLTFLGAQGVLYFAVLLLIESQLLRRFCYKLRRHSSLQDIYIDADEVSVDEASFVPEDEDVKDERRRIVETPLDNLLATKSIVVSELSRTYDRNLAVDRLSFGVGRGECFGLLGINGAGKTTTFQMLTGDIVPTDGDAYINSFSIMHAISQVVISIAIKPKVLMLVFNRCSKFYLIIVAYRIW